MTALLAAPDLAEAARGRGQPGQGWNVVVVLTDDQRADTVSAMPQVMARLAQQGVTFTESFVTSPYCLPSRLSLYSGRYASKAGPTLDDFDPTTSIAVALDAKGYATGLFGKYANGFGYESAWVDGEIVRTLQGYEPPPGWDVWRAFVGDTDLYFDYTLSEDGALVSYGSAETDYSTDVLGAMAVDFVHEHADEPFFLVYAPFAPHEPATPAARHAGSFADLPPWRPASYLEGDTSDKPAWVNLLRLVLEALPPAQQAQILAERDQFRIDQLETLLAVDENVGAILDALEQEGVEDETVVVFTSDNGFLWTEHWATGKFAAFEESIRVPLIIRHPAIAPRNEHRIALNVDLAPTIARLAGVGAFHGDGQSLTRVLDDSAGTWRADFVIEHTGGPFVLVPTYRALRSSSWMLVRSSPGAMDELYELTADAGELDNALVTRAGDPSVAATAQQLRRRLRALETQLALPVP